MSPIIILKINNDKFTSQAFKIHQKFKSPKSSDIILKVVKNDQWKEN